MRFGHQLYPWRPPALQAAVMLQSNRGQSHDSGVSADDKGSAIADKYGLAAIGVKNIGATAKSITHRIAHLQASEKDKERLGCLGECAKWYKYADAKIGEAAKDIASGTKGGLEDAELALIRAMYAPLICEEGFEKIHKPSPLATEDAKFYKEAVITKFVTGHCSLDV
ncbi:hypothetical protein HU200_033001 [Digitaria exilis]|uniref:Pectinesterase inhibitor domain-containing protein n=1 Tax=Digitaria exilis TaxID=1010633 RepID=A0A835ENN7_9POAL|nr:hypothetical protein HU200_033001 [Digitaria exilis]